MSEPRPKGPEGRPKGSDPSGAGEPRKQEGKLVPKPTPELDAAFADCARRGSVEELEDFLWNRVGRLRGFLRERFGAEVPDARERELLLRAAVRHAARNAAEAPPAGAQGGVELWLWRIGLDEALGHLRECARAEGRPEPDLPEDFDLVREFFASPAEPAPSFLPNLAKWSSEEFILALKRREDHAWFLLEENVRSVFRLLMRGGVPRHVRRKFDTDDLHQSAMFHAFSEIDSLDYRGKDSFRAWLVKIFRNRLRDRMRKLGTLRRDFLREESDSALLDGAGAHAPEDLQERAEELAAIVLAFSELSQKSQRVLAMRICDRRSTAEIALDFGVTERTVRRWIVEAFEELQRLRRRGPE